jgi:plasmid maintenance system killer protein
MIKGFRHAGLEKFFFTGSKKGIQPNHARPECPRIWLLLAGICTPYAET